MSEFTLPDYDRLGPDPEPVGARADRLLEAAAAGSHRPAASIDLLPDANLTGPRA